MNYNGAFQASYQMVEKKRLEGEIFKLLESTHGVHPTG